MISPEPRPTRPLRGITYKLCSVLVFIAMAGVLIALVATVVVIVATLAAYAAGAAYYPFPARMGRERARLVASWSTTEADVDQFLAALR